MENEEKIQPKIVQTYAEDMANVIKDQKGGVIKKMIHGEEAHEAEREKLSPESKKNKLFLYLSLLFILLALGILFFFIFVKGHSTVPIAEQFIPVIFNDASAYLEVQNLNKDKIAETVRTEAVGTKVKRGGVEGIYLTENGKSVGLREFITLIKAKFIPGEPVFVSDNFLLGVYNGTAESAISTGADFFMLIKVRSLPDVFDSLHAWESQMLSDLRGFFGISSSIDTQYLFNKNFEDGLIENKNARILYDKNGSIVMMYIYANETSVIITNAPDAAREIMLRLASGQIKK